MKRRFVIAATLALSLGALPLLAQGPSGRPGGQGRGGRGLAGPGGPGGPPGIMGMVHQLDLTDTQREQLRTLMEDGRQGGDPGEAIRSAEQKLHAAVLADRPDLQAIDSLKAALNSAHAAELDHRIDMMQKIAQILTPAQKQQLLTMQPLGPPPGRGRGRG
jgi:Spy/CpxP family protein refolding chaperone